jgi:hypothetical protein
MDKRRPAFSLSDFKKWMEHDDSSNRNVEGKRVTSTLSPKKLLAVAEADQGDLYESVRAFYRHGGTVLNQEGEYVLVDAGTGTFYVNRKAVR